MAQDTRSKSNIKVESQPDESEPLSQTASEHLAYLESLYSSNSTKDTMFGNPAPNLVSGG